ncbi:MAG: MFS transporter [Planctomycetes bacterium]|nr:MFS transporter [Planctomycetota bacterium]
MLFRFSLYGFLKNQRYFEAFLFLAFLGKGLDFLHIGLLVAARELTVNIVEVPSGAIADICGRRRSMIVAFAAYIASFLVFALVDPFPLLLAGMVLYGIGDAFRTGTHKAMIFAWLRLEGRTDERVKVYGYTRSWSKIGSAVSVVIGAVTVVVSADYRMVFLAAIAPYALGIVNFLGYPKVLDGTPEVRPSLGAVTRHMIDVVREAVKRRPIRGLVLEAMGFDGVFAAAKDYLQPVLEATVIAAAAGQLARAGGTDVQRTAVLVGAVYFVLFLLAGAASRGAHRLSDAAGGENRAARFLWVAAVVVYAILAAAGFLGGLVVMIGAFVALHVLHNFWRPVLISRFDVHGTETQGASLLSIESQAGRLATMLVAPLLGWAVDATMAGAVGGAYWPVGAVGLLIAIVFAGRGIWGRAPSRS